MSTPPRTPVPTSSVQAALATYGIAWRQQAACGPDTAELFYGPASKEPPHAQQQRIATAKAICARCPVQTTCRAYALAAREPYGIWGGLTEADRARILHTTREAAA